MNEAEATVSGPGVRPRKWIAFVMSGKYPARWQDRVFTGHVSWRWPLRTVVYGANAMHWAVNVWWRGNYWCFHPTTRTFGGKWPWYFYISPNATPWAAVYKVGPGAGRS